MDLHPIVQIIPCNREPHTSLLIRSLYMEMDVMLGNIIHKLVPSDGKSDVRD